MIRAIVPFVGRGAGGGGGGGGFSSHIFADAALNVGATPGGTAGVTTTGSTLIVGVVWFTKFSGTTDVSMTDNKGNTYTALTLSGGAGNDKLRMFYCINPTVGTSHTFTSVGAGSTSSYASISVAGFSGVKTTGAFDQEAIASDSSGTTKQPGSITPVENNELIISGYGCNSSGGTIAVSAGYTLLSSVTKVCLAYKIQTTAAAENPTWTRGSSDQLIAGIASFRKA